MTPNRSFFLFAALVLALAGCTGSPSGAEPTNPGEPPAGTAVVVLVLPGLTTVDACGLITFRATVTGTSNPAVAWSVKEGPAGGTVTPEGIYTAPGAAGTYHVAASSVADSTRSAEAAVVVGPEKVLSVAVTPGTTSVTPSGALAFAAIVTTSCGSFAAP